jgi:iron(III) transport system substrate-binding protein
VAGLLALLRFFSSVRPRGLRTLLGAWLALGACTNDGGRTVVTVYSPHDKALLSYYETEFERANPDIDVQWLDLGSQEILERIRAEAANPQADVWFGAPSEAFNRAARENLLEPYAPTWADKVGPEARDSAGNWFGTYITPEVIGYNSAVISDAEAPKDWDDVLDPKWRGRILIRDPVASGTMRAIFGAIITRSMNRTGSPEQGYEWLRRLDAQTKEYTLNPALLYQKLERQEGDITLWDMPDMAMLQERGTLRYVIPAGGTPLIVDAIAIVRGTPTADAAKKYYEFVTTPEALVAAANRFYRIPARTDVPPEQLPQWIRDSRARLTPMPVDHARLDEWMTYWDSHIRNSGRRQ